MVTRPYTLFAPAIYQIYMLYGGSRVLTGSPEDIEEACRYIARQAGPTVHQALAQAREALHAILASGDLLACLADHPDIVTSLAVADRWSVLTENARPNLIMAISQRRERATVILGARERADLLVLEARERAMGPGGQQWDRWSAVQGIASAALALGLVDDTEDPEREHDIGAEAELAGAAEWASLAAFVREDLRLPEPGLRVAGLECLGCGLPARWRPWRHSVYCQACERPPRVWGQNPSWDEIDRDLDRLDRGVIEPDQSPPEIETSEFHRVVKSRLEADAGVNLGPSWTNP